MGFTIDTEEVVDRDIEELKVRTGIRTTSELFRRSLVALRRELDALQERRQRRPADPSHTTTGDSHGEEG